MNTSVLKEELSGRYFAKHGCAWFDMYTEDVRRDPNHCAGWYSIAGSDAKRFSSWKELPKEVVWWTNLSRAESWSLGRWSTFKDGGLFGPDWPAIMAESSRSLSPESLAAGVSVWSETFSRCAEWLSSWSSQYDVENPWDWGEGNLADALAPRLGFLPEKQELIQPILKNAYLEVIEEEIPSKLLVGKRKVVLAYPRVEHARKMWNVSFPKGDWKEVKELSEHFPDRVDFIWQQKNPVLARIDSISWRDGYESEGRLWLGLRGRRFPAADFEPIWLTGEEVKLLNSFAIVEVACVYIADGWQKKKIPDGWSLGYEDPLVGFSWSQSLLSSSLWLAAASPTRDPINRKKSYFTSRAVWWRAQDRIESFKAALNLQKNGFTIMSYGQGQVTILFDPNEKPEKMMESIQDSGLLMPELLARIIPLEKEVDFNNIVHVNRWLKKIGGSSTLLDIDRLVAPWAGDSLKTILEASAQKLISVKDFPSPEWETWWKSSLRVQAKISVARLKEKLKRQS